MELMNQPFSGQLGNRLIELLDSPDYHTLNLVVAFARNSGVLRIKDSLEKFRERGGSVNAYVGVDLDGTSYEALTALLLHTDSLIIVHSETSQTFHPKIYQFLGEAKGLVVVGSHNLTGGGLWTNFESSMHISLDKSIANEIEILNGINEYIGQLESLNDSFMPVGSQGDIDKLLENGYIFKEVAEQVRRAKAAAKDGGREPLFGKGAAARLPRISASSKVKVAAQAAPGISAQAASEAAAHPVPEVSVPRCDAGQTIWFETGLMTGGSRNILDLSKKSLIERGSAAGTPFDLDSPKFMRGGVEFFGLNPSATDQEKNITINFDGVDYKDNTILFPEGKKANGTWRLQIKGISSSERQITHAFAAKAPAGEHYLVKKVITFTKVQDDYYFMSVFPESDLENFQVASLILARNGSTTNARQLGLL